MRNLTLILFLLSCFALSSCQSKPPELTSPCVANEFGDYDANTANPCVRRPANQWIL